MIITVDANQDDENLLKYIKNKQLDGAWSNKEVKNTGIVKKYLYQLYLRI